MPPALFLAVQSLAQAMGAGVNISSIRTVGQAVRGGYAAIHPLPLAQDSEFDQHRWLAIWECVIGEWHTAPLGRITPVA
jgi:hypothetical protein